MPYPARHSTIQYNDLEIDIHHCVTFINGTLIILLHHSSSAENCFLYINPKLISR